MGCLSDSCSSCTSRRTRPKHSRRSRLTATARPSNCPLGGGERRSRGQTKAKVRNCAHLRGSLKEWLSKGQWPSPAWLLAAAHRKTKVPPAPRPSTSLGLKEIFPTTVSCSAGGRGEGGLREPLPTAAALPRPGSPASALPRPPPSTPRLVPDCLGPVSRAATQSV